MPSHITRLETQLEAVPEALVGVDQSGVIRFINHQTEALFGYQRGHLIGQPLDTLMPDHLWKIYTDHREDYFADPGTWSVGLELELKGSRRDGTQFPVNVTLAPIETGHVLVLVKSATDVARWRDALENAARMTSIVEDSCEAIIGQTLGGVVTSWNQAAEKLYGYSRFEMVHGRADVLLPQDRAREMKDLLTRVAAGQVTGQLATRRIRKDGSSLSVTLSVSPIRDADGAIIGASTITHEVATEVEPGRAQ